MVKDTYLLTCRKLRRPISNPYAFNSEVNKSCDKQSYALDKSMKIVPTSQAMPAISKVA